MLRRWVQTEDRIARLENELQKCRTEIDLLRGHVAELQKIAGTGELEERAKKAASVQQQWDAMWTYTGVKAGDKHE